MRRSNRHHPAEIHPRPRRTANDTAGRYPVLYFLHGYPETAEGAAQGDHGNRIRERFESQVVRFFFQHLSAPEERAQFETGGSGRLY